MRLCRFVKDPSLWACLAAMSAYAKDLMTAEVAYAALDEVRRTSNHPAVIAHSLLCKFPMNDSSY